MHTIGPGIFAEAVSPRAILRSKLPEPVVGSMWSRGQPGRTTLTRRPAT